jgi:hypothetical protein
LVHRRLRPDESKHLLRSRNDLRATPGHRGVLSAQAQR